MNNAATMSAVQLLGHGGYEQLHYQTGLPIPVPVVGEVLVKVLAAGINNTDINTRLGWYSSSVATATSEIAETAKDVSNGDWTGQGLHFPRIQGADVCGIVIAAGPQTPDRLIGKRVIIQSCLLSLAKGSFTPFLGSERDGGFAQYVTAPFGDVYPVNTSLSDSQLAAVPCAYGTAENLLQRTGVKSTDSVLITGASGNVGIALLQLAKRRGADVTAVAARSKHAAMREIGADQCVETGQPVLSSIGKESIDVVIDVVGGPQWPDLLDVLRPRGRYAVSGAIAGPIVELDLRKLYLKDLTFFGCTAQAPEVFPAIIEYLERGEIVPLVSKTYPLQDIAQAQEEFLSKRQIGKIVLIPPQQ